MSASIGFLSCVSGVQQLLLEAQKRDDLRPDTGVDCPFAPIVQVGFEVEVYESVVQRPWHCKVNAALGGRVPSCEDNPFGIDVHNFVPTAAPGV